MKQNYLKPECSLFNVKIEKGFAVSVNLDDPWIDDIFENEL